MKKTLLILIGCFAFGITSSDAAVVQRPSLSAIKQPIAGGRPSTTGRMPSVSAPTVQQPQVEEPAPEPEPIVEEPTPTVPETLPVENKSRSFENVFSESESSNDNRLSESIRAARAAAAAEESASAIRAATAANNSGVNACDTSVRTCMKEKCGDDFTKCALDGDTFWGDKIESCKRGTNCAGDEFRAVSDQIKADRDFNVAMLRYESIMKCGRDYNSCISEKCGKGYAKCLGKSGEDLAIAECAKVSQKCLEADSGLQSRTSAVLANIRVDTEKNVAVWEKQLDDLRDKMAEQCNKMGAMFDTRSLECVFTVEFTANNNGTQTLFSSQKLPAGAGYTCTPEWFGIDITTFRENAIRLTRSQSGASSAMLGAGLGMGAGMITSGAINRAIDTQKANNAVKEEECTQGGGTWKSVLGIRSCKCPDGEKYDKKEKKCVEKDSDEKEKESDEESDEIDIENEEDEKTAKQKCNDVGGSWIGIGSVGKCRCSGKKWDKDEQQCVDKTSGQQQSGVSNADPRCSHFLPNYRNSYNECLKTNKKLDSEEPDEGSKGEHLDHIQQKSNLA